MDGLDRCQAGINGNFSLDPRFCDIAADDYYLRTSSPCLADYNACGQLIGVYGIGCPCCIDIVGNIVLDIGTNCEDVVDQTVDITDLTNLIDHLFISYTPYCCLEESDIYPAIIGGQSDGMVDISDLTSLIDHIMGDHPPLPECP